MKCKNCGNELMDGDNFCMNCGTPVDRSEAENTPAAQEPAAEAAAPVQESAPAAQEPAAEAAAPVQESAPAVQEPAAEAAAPVQESAPAAQEPAAEAAAPVQESAPAAQEPATEAAAPAQETKVSLEKAAEPAPEAAAGETTKLTPENAPAAEAAPASAEAGEEKKGSFLDNLKKPVWIAAAAAIVVLLIVLCFFGKISNAVRKAVYSPEKYYQYVEKASVTDIAKSAGAIYGNYITDAVSFYDKSIDGSFAVELGKAGEDVLDLLGYTGADISWLKKMEVSAGVDIKDKMIGYTMDFSLNKDKLAAVSVALDAESQILYLQLPEFTKQVLGADLDGAMDNYDEVVDRSKSLAKSLPASAAVNKLLDKYLKVALSQVQEVKKKDKAITVNGLTMNVTELKVTITDETLDDMKDALKDEMEKDKELKKIFTTVVKAAAADEIEKYDLDLEEGYESFVQELAGIVDGLRYYARTEDGITMKVYVDGNGDVVGRDVTMSNGWSESSISYKKVTKGGKTGFEVSIKDGTEIKITGTGKDSSSALSGDFEVKVGGTSYVDLKIKNLNKNDLKKGILNGSFTVSLSSSLVKSMGIPNKFKNMEFDVTVKSTANSANVVAALNMEKDNFATITASYKKGSGSKTSVPSKVVMIDDEEDLAEWLESIDLSKLIKKISKMGVPEEVMDVLEEIEDALDDGDIDDFVYSFQRYMRRIGRYF